jgi:hypothetical protein
VRFWFFPRSHFIEGMRPETLRACLDELAAAGPPPPPLGGVIDVSGRFGLVQIISYSGRFPAAIEDAVNVDDGVPVKAALRGPM